MGFLDQLGDLLKGATTPQDVVEGAKEQVKEKVSDLSKDVFKKSLDALGLTVVFNMLSKIFPIQNLFPFLMGDAQKQVKENNSEKNDTTKENNSEKNDTTKENMKSDFQNMFQSNLLHGGASVARLINNKAPQSIKTACYNLAENFRWTKFKQNLVNQQPSFQNNEEKEEMRAAKYMTKEIDNYPVGTVFWVQANIDPTDVGSRNARNGNHWLTYVGKNNEGLPLIADQNNVRPIKENDFYSNRFVHKIYPPAQTA